LVFAFSNILFIISVPIICIESTNTHLRTNGCALSSQRISLHAPLFPYQNSSINKGIRAQQENFTATKGATVGIQARVGNTKTVGWCKGMITELFLSVEALVNLD
jgi:hypothetical protein